MARKVGRYKDVPKVCPISGKMSKRWGEGTVVIPAPAHVAAIMQSVPRGKLITIEGIRMKVWGQALFCADRSTCPGLT